MFMVFKNLKSGYYESSDIEKKDFHDLSRYTKIEIMAKISFGSIKKFLAFPGIPTFETEL